MEMNGGAEVAEDSLDENPMFGTRIGEETVGDVDGERNVGASVEGYLGEGADDLAVRNRLHVGPFGGIGCRGVGVRGKRAGERCRDGGGVGVEVSVEERLDFIAFREVDSVVGAITGKRETEKVGRRFSGGVKAGLEGLLDGGGIFRNDANVVDIEDDERELGVVGAKIDARVGVERGVVERADEGVDEFVPEAGGLF